MSEYDYSPEAFEAHIRKQQTIARWIEMALATQYHPKNPFIPANPAVQTLAPQRTSDLDDEYDSEARSRRHHRQESKDRRDRRLDSPSTLKSQPAHQSHSGLNPTLVISTNGMSDPPNGPSVVPPERITQDEHLNEIDHDNPMHPQTNMFSSAHNFSINGSAIHNVGGNLTIIQNTGHDNPSSWGVLSQFFNLFSTAKSHIFNAADLLKRFLPRGFSTSSGMNLEETFSEDAIKYPPLPNVQVLQSKITMCIPGFASQTLSSFRYSFP